MEELDKLVCIDSELSRRKEFLLKLLEDKNKLSAALQQDSINIKPLQVASDANKRIIEILDASTTTSSQPPCPPQTNTSAPSTSYPTPPPSFKFGAQDDRKASPALDPCAGNPPSNGGFVFSGNTNDNPKTGFNAEMKSEEAREKEEKEASKRRAEEERKRADAERKARQEREAREWEAAELKRKLEATHTDRYGSRWAGFKEGRTFEDVPWPVLEANRVNRGPLDRDNLLLLLTKLNIKSCVLRGIDPSDHASIKRQVKIEQLRFHPDKVATWTPGVLEKDREAVKAACETISKFLNSMMEDAAKASAV